MSIFERNPIFTTTTPWPKVPQVTLFRDTWDEHIIKQHVHMAGQELQVRAVASNPTLIVPGTSNPDYVIYVSDSVTTTSGTPLAVIINPQEKLIVSAYYNRSLRVVVAGQSLWSR